jgi:ketosteroid isomerase-like protein
VDQVGGSCDLAYARGHSRVAWTTGKGAEAKKSSNAGTNLTLLRRQADGTWRISHQMWDDPPPQPAGR